jgi:ADP-L-glycero-D-manno-heptose 6-epimerase
MIIVTGGAGFVGSNLVRHLNDAGVTNILIVDDIRDGRKIFNLADCRFVDYLDKEEFLARIKAGRAAMPAVSGIFHQGALTDTTEWDGRLMMENNFEYSKQLLHFCQEHEISFIYASSASVYGSGREFRVAVECERPINAYAFSKWQFDQYVRATVRQPRSQVAGLRYFNVYGPREAHKERMASVVYHFHRQLSRGDEVRLFTGSGGYGDGEQRRDFIHVDDIAAINLWFFEHPDASGIFNAGTGTSRSFNAIARAVIDWHGQGKITYIEFPAELTGSYQSFTQADLTELRSAGYAESFLSIEEGVRRYLDVIGSSNEAD